MDRRRRGRHAQTRRSRDGSVRGRGTPEVRHRRAPGVTGRSGGLYERRVSTGQTNGSEGRRKLFGMATRRRRGGFGLVSGRRTFRSRRRRRRLRRRPQRFRAFRLRRRRVGIRVRAAEKKTLDPGKRASRCGHRGGLARGRDGPAVPGREGRAREDASGRVGRRGETPPRARDAKKKSASPWNVPAMASKTMASERVKASPARKKTRTAE